MNDQSRYGVQQFQTIDTQIIAGKLVFCKDEREATRLAKRYIALGKATGAAVLSCNADPLFPEPFTAKMLASYGTMPPDV